MKQSSESSEFQEIAPTTLPVEQIKDAEAPKQEVVQSLPSFSETTAFVKETSEKVFSETQEFVVSGKDKFASAVLDLNLPQVQVAEIDKRLQTKEKLAGIEESATVLAQETHNKISIFEKILEKLKGERAEGSVEPIKGGVQNPELMKRMESRAIKKPYEKRIEKIRRESNENLKTILMSQTGTSELSPAEVDKVEVLRDTFKVVVGCGTDRLSDIVKGGRFRSVLESEKVGRLSRILRPDSFHTRIDVEKRMGILSTGTKNDPDVIYGSGILGDVSSLANPNFAQVRLRSERIRNRTTFSYGDSFQYPKMDWKKVPVVTWDDAPTLEYLRTKEYDPTLPIGRIGASYTEAQISGGVTLEDVEEITIAVDSEDQREQYMNSSWAKKLSQDYPEVTLSFPLAESVQHKNERND